MDRSQPVNALGPIGRVGRWAATHRRIVGGVWVALALGLGVLAPQVEHALSGAGWEATDSESVDARKQIDANFSGSGSYALQVVLSSKSLKVGDAPFAGSLADAKSILAGDHRVSKVVPPRRGVSISRDGHTAILVGGADAPPDEMVRAADDLKDPLSNSAALDITTDLAGAPGMWSDFNEANKQAMLKSEVISWPVTLVILVLAFGSLVAAGLPLLLTVLGLVAAAGMLFLTAQLFDISIWAMNFALMFALALGIDYALFIVARFRQAHFEDGLSPIEATAQAMETAGKAVFFSGVTVLIALSAVLLVPSPAFRSMAVGIMLAVTFVLAAALTLLPAMLAKLGSKVNRLSPRWLRRDSQRSPRLAAWVEQVWRRPALFGALGLAAVAVLAWPVSQLETGMPSITVVPQGDSSRKGYDEVQRGFGPGAPGTLQIVTPGPRQAETLGVLERSSGISSVLPPRRGTSEQTLIAAVPSGEPSGDGVRDTIDQLRADLPPGTLVGGAVAENHDLEVALADSTPLVIGVILLLGFLLLLVALRAPAMALVGVALNVLATLASFGVAKWIFQDGVFSNLLGFESQGYLDAWAPVFFFAMLFALGMDYTVFLLASAKERWDASGDAHEATVEGIAISGPVITAAAAVMVAVFFTFALSGPLPPKEMGVILGVAVLIDAALVRLILMPVAMRLLQHRAWWLPKWLDQLLPAVRFGHA